MPGHESLLRKVARHWARSPSLAEKPLIAWMEQPWVKRHINARITGDAALDWFTYVNRKYVPVPLRRALSLGCGEGGLERHAFFLGTVDFFDAIDVSPGALEKARRAAQEAGVLHKVNYTVADLNHLCLPPQTYDAVFASMSIHHISALETLCEQICFALRPGGSFICNEYVGPTQFQLPAEQLRLINDLLSILPKKFHRIIRNGVVTSDIKTAHTNHPLSWFADNDPSEAVRSADILPVLRQFFDFVEYKPYGGALLHFLLENIVGNFHDGEEDHDAWLNMLAYVEKLLEDKGVIASDFALMVAMPKSGYSG